MAYKQCDLFPTVLEPGQPKILMCGQMGVCREPAAVPLDSHLLSCPHVLRGPREPSGVSLIRALPLNTITLGEISFAMQISGEHKYLVYGKDVRK